MTLFESIIIAIVEGITEYLPISSTGHMIITSSLLGIHKDEFTKLFEVAIQLGAILAVVVLYWKKFFDFSKWQFYVKLIVAVIPALIFGKLFSDRIDAMLESPTTVAVTLLLGGIVLLFIDKVFINPTIEREEDITYKRAFVIGIWQCLAMIPGVSRSASSIIGGMQQKLTRKLAAEFSFYLAVPTMCAATGYKLMQGYKTFTTDHIQLLVVGNLVAFIVAIIAIKFFIGFLQKHGFKLFGWYRIIAGVILLVLIGMGVIVE
ncbi:MAG: undecaprenyl-diphosphate phosphatase [Chitinophagaceae bacterium]|nr:undecaprenyl-diphosphate phosphatase [Chitinophagaceae bacterium]